jgi:hypothetical protein
MSWSVESREISYPNVQRLETAFYLHATTRSGTFGRQITDRPPTTMKIVELPTCSLSIHRNRKTIHTKRPHTSQHTAEIQNGNHHHDVYHVPQYSELSTHSLERCHCLGKLIRNTLTESKIGNAYHQPAK